MQIGLIRFLIACSMVHNITSAQQQAYIKASNTGPGDVFGVSVAISGNRMVVGALFEDSGATGINGTQADDSAPSSGAAYVFVRDADGSWRQEAYLKPSNTGPGDNFGRAVAISGDTIVVGAPNEKSSAVGVDGDQFNDSAPSSGAAYVFVRNAAGDWSQQAYLKASNTAITDRFGFSVVVSSDTVVVGAPNEDSGATGINGSQADNSAADSGAVYIFVRTGPTWSQQAYLKASNTDAGDGFGVSVAMSEDTVVVGAIGEDSSATRPNGNQADNGATDSGAAYVFVREGTNWSQQAYLKSSNTGAVDWFGYSVAVSGDTLVVGARDEDSGATGINGNQSDNSAVQSGAAYVFVRAGGVWTQQAYLKASNSDGAIDSGYYGDMFGASVSISENVAVIGAPYEDSSATGLNGDQLDENTPDSGAAYVFAHSGSVWTQRAYFKGSNTGAGDEFGFSVAASGDTVVVGAPLEASSATGVGGDATDDSAHDSGAVYVFGVFCPADLNHDGFVDGIDQDLFNGWFESADPDVQGQADYNYDGFVDGMDYDDFNRNFERGC